MTVQIEEAAQRLLSAAESGKPCEPVRDLIGPDDLDAAYAVQRRNTERRTAQGAAVAGRKIGLTSPAVQRQFGVFQPDFGTLFADLGHASGEPVALGTLLQPRVEAEVAFVIGRDLDNPWASVADVLRATDFVLAAIEIVDSRIAGWDIRIADTVADNASSGRYVLGTVPRPVHGLDLAAAGMVLEHGGAEVSAGSGAACMGSPVVAVAWLARELSRRGTPLREGEIVLSGALGPLVPVPAAGRYRARIDGIGTVDAVFEERSGKRFEETARGAGTR